MSRVPSFYSLREEVTTRAAQRIYHTHSACFVGQNIPYHDRRQGQEITQPSAMCTVRPIHREGR